MAKAARTVDTFLGTYTLGKQLGAGGASRVHAATSPDGEAVAIKLLEGTTTDKRKRFLNEAGFLERDTHPHIVRLLDKGVCSASGAPFYVMPVFASSLRKPMQARSIAPEQALGLFAKILDGVEAAHLHGVIHRDLKPENVLCSGDLTQLVVADFGIAHFAETLLITAVETGDRDRLANFMYAAPEQRTPGTSVDQRADIYALGLMLNELFTGQVPHGAGYREVAAVASAYAWLDPLIRDMIGQDPQARPADVAAVKTRLRQYAEEAVTQQRLSALSQKVIPVGEIEDPLAHVPLRVIDTDWQPNGLMKLYFDRQIHRAWIDAFRRMPSYQWMPGFEPARFTLQPDHALITGVREQDVGDVLHHFEQWLPLVTQTLYQDLHAANQRRQREERAALAKARQDEEARLRVLQRLKQRAS